MKQILLIAFIISQVVWCPQIYAQENKNSTEKEDSLEQKKRANNCRGKRGS